MFTGSCVLRGFGSSAAWAWEGYLDAEYGLGV